MSFQMGRGFRNPLMRRVRRHSTMATLFRAPSAPQPVNLISSDQQTQAVPEGSSSFVQATLGGIEGTAPILSAPQPVPQIQGAPESRTPQVQQIPTPSTTDSANLQQAASTLQHPVTSAATPHAPDSGTITPPTTETATLPDTATREMETDAAITDTVWRRLQTIFRRHQKPPTAAPQDGTRPPLTSPSEGITSDSESASAGETASPAQIPSPAQSTLHPSAQIQRSLEPESESRHESAGESEQTPQLPQTVGPEPPAALGRIEGSLSSPPRAGTSPSEQGVVPIPQPQPERGDDILEVTPPFASAPSTPTSSLLSEVSADTVDSSVQPIFAQRSPTPSGGESQVNQLGAIQTPPSSSSPRIQRVADPTMDQDKSPIPQATGMETPPEIQLSMGGEAPHQTTPLQDAWQVERLTPAATSPAPVQEPRAIGQSDSSTGREIQASISRVLDSVAAGGPTSSSIEVVAPRHPRPVIQPASRRMQQPTIMRQPAAPPKQQQTLASPQERMSSGEEDVVDTAIGPLPTDLWTLIDEPIPPTVRRQPAIVERERGFADYAEPVSQVQPVRRRSIGQPTSPDAVPQTHQERETRATTSSISLARVQPVRTPSISPTPQAPSQIQRVAEQYGGDTATSDEEQRSTASLDAAASGQEQQQDESSSEEGGIDIDDLARKVYAEVKRKLTVEWERLRTRF